MKKLITAIAFLLLASSGYSQDPQFTQTFAAPLRANPALMGANPDLRVIINYRTQWANIDKGYNTARFTVMSPVLMQETSKLDVGLSVINDRAGAFNTMDAQLAVSYNLQLTENNHNLAVAIYGGYVQNQVNAANLTFDEQYVMGSYNAANPTGEQVLNEQSGYADAGFGAFWFYNPSVGDEPGINAFAGFSGYHLNSPNQSLTNSESELPARYTSIAGVKIFTGNKLDFTPNMRISTQGGSQEIAAGLYTDYKINDQTAITLGTWYRQRNNIAFVLGMKYTNFTLGYSYDLPGTQINRVIPGVNTHEITLSYGINRAKKKGLDYGAYPVPLY